MMTILKMNFHFHKIEQGENLMVGRKEISKLWERVDKIDSRVDELCERIDLYIERTSVSMEKMCVAMEKLEEQTVQMNQVMNDLVDTMKEFSKTNREIIELCDNYAKRIDVIENKMK